MILNFRKQGKRIKAKRRPYFAVEHENERLIKGLKKRKKLHK